MLLTIATTHVPATDLGYLLHKHPGRFQGHDLNFGRAHVFYPEANETRCEACLLLEVDPVGLVRGKNDSSFVLAQYVNDRPYVASSFLSVAIAQVFGSALSGNSKDRPELVKTAIPLEVKLEALPVRGGEKFLRSVFEPLGYEVQAAALPLDTTVPDWGDSPYLRVTLRKTAVLSELLSHLYVLIPVFDNAKHYFVGDDEVEKLLRKGEGWLESHPLKEAITRRYLRNRANLTREALSRLTEEVPTEEDEGKPRPEDVFETPIRLHEQRHQAVLAALIAAGAKSVIDLGCGEGRLMKELVRERSFTRVVGMDVSVQALQIAHRRLGLDRAPQDRVQLLHGSLMYRDQRMEGFDAAAVVEVVEHLDPPRLAAFEEVLFGKAKPGTVVLTTPNRDYNAMWESLPAGKFRHPDHRFEWTRAEFHAWCEGIAERFGYTFEIRPLGPVNEKLGAPSQMGIFTKNM